MSDLLILAPLAIEARALRRGLASLERPGDDGRGVRVERTGMGPNASTLAGARLPATVAGGAQVVVAGFCGGLRSHIQTGDVVVATEIRGPEGVLLLHGAATIADRLRLAGLTVHLGPILSSPRLALGGRRSRMASDGTLAVDMESYWLLRDHSGEAAVIRAVSDTAGPGLLGGMLPLGWLRACRSLQRVAAALGASEA
jgi:4-hydroxy-3-methylbut-2-en-1-yl diphosphate reductase